MEAIGEAVTGGLTARAVEPNVGSGGEASGPRSEVKFSDQLGTGGSGVGSNQRGSAGASGGGSAARGAGRSRSGAGGGDV